MTPLKFWGIALLAGAFCGIFWLELVVGAWLSVVGIGIAAFIGMLSLDWRNQ